MIIYDIIINYWLNYVLFVLLLVKVWSVTVSISFRIKWLEFNDNDMTRLARLLNWNGILTKKRHNTWLKENNHLKKSKWTMLQTLSHVDVDPPDHRGLAALS